MEMLRIDYASVYIVPDLAEPKVVEPDGVEYLVYYFPFGFLLSSVKKYRNMTLDLFEDKLNVCVLICVKNFSHIRLFKTNGIIWEETS